MRIFQRIPIYWLQLLVFLVCFLVALSVNFACDKEDPTSAEECGSGTKQWDEKRNQCINLSTGKVVPNKCCGH